MKPMADLLQKIDWLLQPQRIPFQHIQRQNPKVKHHDSCYKTTDLWLCQITNEKKCLRPFTVAFPKEWLVAASIVAGQTLQRCLGGQTLDK
jgi:hypothetical protein